MTLSVVLITFNEEANIRRTLESVLPLVRPHVSSSEPEGEIIIVDNGSTDRTVEIARELGAKVFIEEWKGYAAQKNSAIAKATGDWILSLDADEVVGHGLQQAITRILGPDENIYRPVAGIWLERINYFLGRAIRHGGFYEKKLRLFRRGKGLFKQVPVHETLEVDGATMRLSHDFEIKDLCLFHHAYPTLSGYIAHMNSYSSLGAEIAINKGHRSFSFLNIVIRPIATFIQKYLLKLGFLDGREGLLLCLYHSVYVSWKYAKAWELSRAKSDALPRT